MPIAREGIREIIWSTVLLGLSAFGAGWIWPPLAVPFGVAWVWVVCFFRDPRRERNYQAGELCSPADGTVTEVTELSSHPSIEGPAVRIGIFLSLFNVHINRFPCDGRIHSVTYRKGEFLDARHLESGERNESNTLVIHPDAPMPGPIVVRQVAGLVARRIICHVRPGDHRAIGTRFGLIKFGSRTELIIPRRTETDILVRVGDSVRAGLSILATQDIAPQGSKRDTMEKRQRVQTPAANS